MKKTLISILKFIIGFLFLMVIAVIISDKVLGNVTILPSIIGGLFGFYILALPFILIKRWWNSIPSSSSSTSAHKEDDEKQQQPVTVKKVKAPEVHTTPVIVADDPDYVVYDLKRSGSNWTFKWNSRARMGKGLGNLGNGSCGRNTTHYRTSDSTTGKSVVFSINF